MKFAFYGSLRRGFPTQKDLGIQSRLRFIADIQICGSLVDLGDFPGLLPGTNPVMAELYEALDPSVVEILDAYEAYDPADAETSLFIRRLHPVSTGDSAWVYFLNRPKQDAAVVASYDWVEYVRLR